MRPVVTRGRDTQASPLPYHSKTTDEVIKRLEMFRYLATPLTKLLGPVFKLLQTLLAHTRTDIGQTGAEIFDADGSDVFGRHVQ
jgi:hypothetical protein